MVNTRITRPEDVGAVLRAYRRDHNLSQIELARRLGVSQRWVSHAENGKPTIQLGLVLRVFNELGIEIVAGREGAFVHARHRGAAKRVDDIDNIVDG